MSIWFYEEQKHSLVLIEYLRRFRPELVPTEAELHAVRFPFDPAPGARDADAAFLRRNPPHAVVPARRPLAHRAGDQAIYETISRDEARHAGRLLPVHEARDRAARGRRRVAFAKIGVLMASAARTGKPLHPTNLHVNKTLFPRDTVQSRLPDPRVAGALARRADPASTRPGRPRWSASILRKLSTLYDRTSTPPGPEPVPQGAHRASSPSGHPRGGLTAARAGRDLSLSR